MTVTYDIYEIEEPITSITDSDDYGYYISSTNVKNIISKYLKEKEYDHIFVAYKLGEDLHKEMISTGDWIGLGGMIYEKDIGYSNIRVPNESIDLLYQYTKYNSFPEEVYVHEFLHGLERIEEEYGNEVIELHSYEEYGYKESEIYGLKEWYRDYMQAKITNNNLGLSKEVFIRKPIQESNFKTSIDFTEEVFKEPKNLIEDIQKLFEKAQEYIDISFANINN